MITSTKVKQQVDRIENLQVNPSLVPPTYNSIQLSGALFTSLEERKFDTSSTVMPPANTSGQLMVIDMAEGNTSIRTLKSQRRQQQR